MDTLPALIAAIAGAVAAVAAAIKALLDLRDRRRERQGANGEHPPPRRPGPTSAVVVASLCLVLAVGIGIWALVRPKPPGTAAGSGTTLTVAATTTSPEPSTAPSGANLSRSCPRRLAFGETVRRSIAQAGQLDCLSFTGAQRDRIWVKVVRTSGDLDPFLELARPDGDKLPCGGVTNPQACTLDVDGTHAIYLKSFRGTGTGGYHLYVQRLNRPERCTPLGRSPVTGSIRPTEMVGCYQFAGAPGDRVSASVVKTSGDLDPYVEMSRPDGNKLPCGGVSNPRTCTLDADGKHTILVMSFSGNGTGGYSIALI
jgi:hypothetical protein